MVDKQTTKSKAQPQVEKYLTEMKELPSNQKKGKEAKKPIVNKKVSKTKDVVKEKTKPEMIVKKAEDVKEVNDGDKFEKTRGNSSDKLITTKDILLGIVNIASLALLIILLIKLPEKAQELNKLRNQVLLSESEVALEIADVEGSKDKASELENLFIDEAGLVNFVSDVEDLKGEKSSIGKISITSRKAIKDKTGNFGIPVIIEMRGNWSQFGEDIQNIQKLPYLFRAIRVDTEQLEEEGVLRLNYGGFLYVDDKLGEN